MVASFRFCYLEIFRVIYRCRGKKKIYTKLKIIFTAIKIFKNVFHRKVLIRFETNLVFVLFQIIPYLFSTEDPTFHQERFSVLIDKKVC